MNIPKDIITAARNAFEARTVASAAHHYNKSAAELLGASADVFEKKVQVWAENVVYCPSCYGEHECHACSRNGWEAQHVIEAVFFGVTSVDCYADTGAVAS